ncbi:hypothetical protein FF1_015794 [Malus domestica]
MSLDRRELVFPKDDARYLSHTLPFCWKMPLDTSTRWSGDCQMLDIVCKASKSMDAVIRKYETLDSRMLLSSAEKNAVSQVHRYLEPFYKITYPKQLLLAEILTFTQNR